jgi:selenophosphate synthetase-related protein
MGKRWRTVLFLLYKKKLLKLGGKEKQRENRKVPIRWATRLLKNKKQIEILKVSIEKVFKYLTTACRNIVQDGKTFSFLLHK